VFQQIEKKHWSTISHFCLTIDYQISFTANWTCLDGVCVDVMSPASAIGAPLESKMFLWSNGGEKFV